VSPHHGSDRGYYARADESARLWDRAPDKMKVRTGLSWQFALGTSIILYVGFTVSSDNRCYDTNGMTLPRLSLLDDVGGNTNASTLRHVRHLLANGSVKMAGKSRLQI